MLAKPISLGNTAYIELLEQIHSVLGNLVLYTWKQLKGKFYYCGISTVISQIKNPRTSHKRKFNLRLHDIIIIFCCFSFLQTIS